MITFDVKMEHTSSLRSSFQYQASNTLQSCIRNTSNKGQCKSKYIRGTSLTYGNNKPYENEVTLRGQKPPLKGCQLLDFQCTFLKGLDLLMLKIWGLQVKGLQSYSHVPFILVSQYFKFLLDFLNHGLFGRIKKIASRSNLEPANKKQLFKVAPIT